MSIDLPEAIYNDTQKAAFFREVTERVDHTTGVVSAGAVLTLPFSGDSYVASFEVIGHPLPNGEGHRTGFQTVTPGYFRAMGIPLLRGRMLNERDDADASPVALINETAARLFFPNPQALILGICINCS
jgi:hypothetical protein